MVNMREIIGTPAGCSGNTRQDKWGSTGPVSQASPVVSNAKTSIFAAVQGFSEMLCDLSYVHFLFPKCVGDDVAVFASFSCLVKTRMVLQSPSFNSSGQSL